MYDQPRYDVQARSAFFGDGRTMRPLPEGVVPREASADSVVSTGWSDAASTWVLTVPDSVVSELGGMEAHVARGQDRYNIYCTPCHGYAGDGDGMVPTRVGGAIRPPTFHDDRLRHIPDGQIFATITHGVRNMPMYAHSIPANDRWAIVSYVRALQLSQQPDATAMNLHGGTGGTP
jgi:mono/diheme cytochrome c family protein